MSAANCGHQPEAVVDAVELPPYRLRKPARFFPAPSMLDLQQLVEQSGQRELIFCMADAARVLEAKRKHCDSLAELAACAKLTCTPLKDVEQSKTARLCSLINEASALAAELGAELKSPGLRAVCFAFTACCQRTATEIGRLQLWNGGY